MGLEISQHITYAFFIGFCFWAMPSIIGVGSTEAVRATQVLAENGRAEVAGGPTWPHKHLS